MPARDSSTGRFIKGGGGGGAEVDRMYVRIMGDGSHYENTLKRTGMLTKNFARMLGKNLSNVGRQMSAMGRSMTLRVTAPIVALGAVSVAAFARFDKAMIESTSIMGNLSDETHESMRKLALDLSFSGDVLQAPKDIAESYFFLASAGKNAEQSMALIKPVATFATAGAFGMAKATDLLTDAQSALGMTSKDVIQDQKNLVAIGDVLVKANTLANASVEQFATSLTTKAGTAFKAFNIDLNQGVALLAAYADQGIKAELAGNAADRMLRLLTKSIAQNANEFKKRNISVFEGGEFRDFDDIIRDLENALSGMSTEMKTATLTSLGFEARTQQVILPLLGTSDALERYAKELSNAAGITDEVANKQMNAFSNQLKIFWNRLKVVAIGIGDKLAPAVTWLSDKLVVAVTWWRNLSDTVQRWVLIGAGVVAAIGPILMIFGTLFSVIGFGITGAVIAFIAFGSVIAAVVGAILSPIGLIITAIVGIGLAILNFTDIGNQALEKIGETWTNLKEIIAPAIQGIKDALVADDMRLAAEILWAQLKLTFLQGTAELRKVWIGFTGWFRKQFNNLFFTLQEIAIKFDATLHGRELNLTEKIQLAAINITKGLLAKSVDAETGKAMIDVHLGVGEAQGELDNLIQKAYQQRVINEFFGRDISGGGGGGSLTAGTGDADTGTDAIGRQVDRTVKAAGIQAASFGGAEARGRIAAFRSGGPDASPQQKAVDELKGIHDALTVDGIVVKDLGLSPAGL